MLVDINDHTYNASDIKLVTRIYSASDPYFCVYFYDTEHPERIGARSNGSEEEEKNFVEHERKRIIKAWSDSLKLGV